MIRTETFEPPQIRWTSFKRGLVTSHFERLRERDGDDCHYCGVTMLFLDRRSRAKNIGGKRAATRDHIVPKCYGGDKSLENFVLACAECNSSRHHEVSMCDCFRCTRVIASWKMDQEAFFDIYDPFSLDPDEWALAVARTQKAGLFNSCYDPNFGDNNG